MPTNAKFLQYLVTSNLIRAIAAAVLGTGLFGLPLLLAAINGHEYIRESLAYRYFSSVRIVDGNLANVWHPQGYLISLIQNVIYFSIDNFSSIPWGQFRLRFNLFGYATNIFINICMFLVLLTTFINRRLTSNDKLLVLVTALAPIFCFSTAGFYYSTLPDYYHLNIVMVAASTSLFLWNYRARGVEPSFLQLVAMGAFIGAAASNKVTMLLISLAALSPLIIASRMSSRQLIARCGILIGCIGVSFYLIFLSFYLFQWEYVLPALLKIVWFSSTISVQPNFETILPFYLFGLGYGYILIAFGCILLFVGYFVMREKPIELKRLLVFVTIFTVGIVQIWFVFRRPAGTTIFESANGLICVMAMLIVLSQKRKVELGLTMLILVITLTLTFKEFGLNNWINSIREGKSVTEKGWYLYERTQNLATPVVVVVPDNEYLWGDPYETLLKGFSDSPTWNISIGSNYLARFRSPISFRTEVTSPGPDYPYPENTSILWFDRKEFTALKNRYPGLNQATQERQCESLDIHVSIIANLCFSKE